MARSVLWACLLEAKKEGIQCVGEAEILRVTPQTVQYRQHGEEKENPGRYRAIRPPLAARPGLPSNQLAGRASSPHRLFGRRQNPGTDFGSRPIPPSKRPVQELRQKCEVQDS